MRKAMGKRKRAILTVFSASFLLACVGAALFELMIWNMNRISPDYLSAGRSAYHLVRSCEARISDEASRFDECIQNADRSVLSL